MTAQRTGVALIRVSKVGGREDLLSPDLQRIAITDYAQRNQILVTEWVEVLDENASQVKSRWWKTLDWAVAQVEAKQFNAVVVWKFSRAARNRRRWAVALDRIEVAGGTLESATEGLDTTTATGRLARGMLAELNAWESEVKSEQWKETHRYRLSQGLPANGRMRFGYVRDGRGFAPDPDLGPLLADLYAQYVNGRSGRVLAEDLNAQGVVTGRGNGWGSRTVLQMLDTGFGAGLLTTKDGFLPGAHKAVISRDLWDAYLRRREEQRPIPPRVKAAQHEFTGILVCGACRGGISPRTLTEWQCNNGRRRTCWPITRAFIPRVAREVREWVFLLAEGTDESLQEQARAARRNELDVRRWRRQQAQAEQRLLMLARKNLSGFYDDPTYLMLRDETERSRQEAVKLLQQQDQAPSVEVFRSLAEFWDEAEPLQRRQLMLTVIKHVIVERAEGPRSAQSRSTYRIVPRW
jgi:DNA invertase Pin-like site-specific DNA recombinase